MRFALVNRAMVASYARCVPIADVGKLFVVILVLSMVVGVNGCRSGHGGVCSSGNILLARAYKGRRRRLRGACEGI